MLRNYKIRPSFFIQFGYPGETREDIEKTIRLINDLMPSEIGISVSYPLPGTSFYEKVKAELKEKANWTDSDELKLMFKNTYPANFYKQLHRYVHKNYRKHIAMNSIRQLLSHPATMNINAVRKAASAAYYVPASFLAKKRLEDIKA